MKTKLLASLVIISMVSGCAVVNTGPTVPVMPGTGKSLEQFQADDAVCRNYAQHLNEDANKAGANNMLVNAAVGTVVGALAGSLFGGHRNSSGAGLGLLMGAAAGERHADSAENSAQARYNISYEQCMTTKGNARQQAYSTYHTAQPVYVLEPQQAGVIIR